MPKPHYVLEVINFREFIQEKIIKTSKFEWTLNDIRIKKDHFGPQFGEVSALLDVKHCPKQQSCAISRKTNDATLRKWQKLVRIMLETSNLTHK